MKLAKTKISVNSVDSVCYVIQYHVPRVKRGS